MTLPGFSEKFYLSEGPARLFTNHRVNKTVSVNGVEYFKEVRIGNSPEGHVISIDDFFKVQLKVGTIVASEKVEGSDKLLKNTVEIEGEPRTIVSGIAKYYTPEQSVGRQVVVVTNLKPIKLRGILSSGMILCAEDEKTKKVCLVSPSEVMPNGSTVC